MGNIWEILRTHHFSPTTSFEHEILLTPKISVMFWTLAQYRDRKKCWVSITRQCNIWKTKIIVGYRSSVPMMPTDGISDPLQNLISHKTWYFCFYCDAMVRPIACNLYAFINYVMTSGSKSHGVLYVSHFPECDFLQFSLMNAMQQTIISSKILKYVFRSNCHSVMICRHDEN